MKPSETCDSQCNLCSMFDQCEDREYDLSTEEIDGYNMEDNENEN